MQAPLPKTLPAFFWFFLRRQKFKFLFLAVTLLPWPGMDMGVPYILHKLIDIFRLGLSKDEALAQAAPYAVILVAMYIAAEICFRTHDYLFAKTLPRFRAEITTAMFEYAIKHSHGYFLDNFAGSIANRVTKLANAMGTVVMDVVSVFVPVLGGVLIGMVMMASISSVFAGVFFLWFVIYAGVMIACTKRTLELSNDHSESVTALSGTVVDLFGNISIMRLFSASRHEREYFARYQDNERQLSEKLQFYIFKCKLFFGSLSAGMCILWWSLAVYFWYQDYITLGAMAQLVLQLWGLIGLTWFMLGRFSGVFEQLGICRESLEILLNPHGVTDDPDAVELNVTKGEIVFDDVHFHYIPGRDIFHDKNIVIRPGEKVGLVGFSGSGKSTFVNLLLRLYDVESGRILIDGQDISRVTQDSLRRQIAMIPQDTSLFHRTLRENIAYGKAAIDDVEIRRVAEEAACHEFIGHLPQGYDTLVGERGVKLSGGQRQRIAIARALLKNAPILILDEATSSLDSLTESVIQQRLGEMMQSRTTIVIAHRLSTLSNVDRILVFDKGEIVEDGNHAELLKQNGHYARLWQMQAGGFLPDREFPN